MTTNGKIAVGLAIGFGLFAFFWFFMRTPAAVAPVTGVPGTNPAGGIVRSIFGGVGGIAGAIADAASGTGGASGEGGVGA